MASKIVSGPPEALENLLIEVTSPLTTNVGFDTFRKIFDRINSDSSAPESALRILAHKIQSPQEKEAISALIILDVCVKHCGAAFHTELSKFKFLNEMVKVLSPKYLGNTTSHNVKEKCIALLYTWQRDLGNKYPKLVEVYTVLKTQGIVTEDPDVPPPDVDQKTSGSSFVDRPDSIFEKSQHASTLAKLLKSRNPGDLREANAIIKRIVVEEDAKIEKKSKRAFELQTLLNNTQLLQDMLKNYDAGEISPSELEIMQDVATSIKNSRPALFSLAVVDDDEQTRNIVDVIDACGRASTILEQYEVCVLRKAPSTVPTSSTETKNTSHVQANLLITESEDQDLLLQDLDMLELEGRSFDKHMGNTPGVNIQKSLDHIPSQKSFSSNVNLLEDILFSDSQAPSSSALVPSECLPLTEVSYCDSSFTPISLKSSPPVYSLTASPAKTLDTSELAKKSSSSQLFVDLDTIGRQMLGMVPTTSSCSLNDLRKNFVNNVPPKVEESSVAFETSSPPSNAESAIKVDEYVSLSSIPIIPLSQILPHPKFNAPLHIFPLENDLYHLDIHLHYTENHPASNVWVLVAVLTSRNVLPISQIGLRFGVDKPFKAHQMPASGTSLPAFCSFLPPTPLQQIILIQNPSNEVSAKLKFQLSFTVDDEVILESGSTTILFE